MALDYNRGSAQRGQVQRGPSSSSLADVLDVILDKGIVIDAWVRISAVGIELLTIEARVVVASVDTYLRYAEAIGLTALAAPPPGRGQGGGGRGDEQDSRRELPSGNDVLGFVSDHPEGLRLGEMEAYFDVPRRELSEVVNQLTEDDQIRLDEEHQLYYPAEDGE
jgi:gas vesicle structural protein